MFRYLKTIKSKFLALLIFIGVLVSFFLLIFFLNINEVAQSLSHYLKVKNFQKQYNTLVLAEQKYLLSGNTSSLDNTDEEILKIRELNQLLVQSIQENYLELSRYQHYLDTLEGMTLTNAEIFSEIIRNLKDKGDQNFGATGDFLQQYHMLISDIVASEDPSLISLLPELEQQAMEFLLSGKVEAGMGFVQFLQEIKPEEELLIFDMGFEEDTAALAEEQLTTKNLEEATMQLARKFEILGISNTEGLTDSLILNALSTNIFFDAFLNEILLILTRTLGGSQVLILIFVLLFVSFFVSFFFILKRFVLEPLRVYQQYFARLSRGIIPEKTAFKYSEEFARIDEKFNDFTADLSKKVEFTRNIDEGNYEIDYKPLSKDDVLGATLLQLKDDLRKASKEEAKFKEEEKIRSWTNEGLASVNEILRRNQSGIQELCDQILQNLVNYINANQGGIFLLQNNEEEEVKSLHLTSFFAYNRKKYIEKDILLGEGLVGTCALEKETTYIREVPDDYISVSSGLGEARPKALLLVPLKVEQELRGVLEIASFTLFQPYEIAFLEKIGEGIASTIASVEINEQTNYLLEQSRIQAEEMSHQEEEMRQNMEELQATQEEASRKEAEFTGMMEALNQSVFIVEFNREGYVISFNAKFQELFGVSRDKLDGKKYNTIFTNQYENDEESFWSSVLNKAVSVNGYVAVNDEKTWLHQTYTPVKDESEHIQKVICVAAEVFEKPANEGKD